MDHHPSPDRILASAPTTLTCTSPAHCLVGKHPPHSEGVRPDPVPRTRTHCGPCGRTGVRWVGTMSSRTGAGSGMGCRGCRGLTFACPVDWSLARHMAHTQEVGRTVLRLAQCNTMGVASTMQVPPNSANMMYLGTYPGGPRCRSHPDCTHHLVHILHVTHRCRGAIDVLRARDLEGEWGRPTPSISPSPT
jgi:hypothetical protein